MEPDDHVRGKEPLAPRTPVPRRRGNGHWQTSEAQGSGSGSGNTPATSSNAGPAMFDSATNAMITGGHFNAHQGDHTNVTININGSRIPRTSGGLVQIRNQPSAQNVVPNADTNPNRNRRRRRPNRSGKNLIRPVQRSNEIYERHLMLKGRGFPLWIPQPNIRLPIPYRAKGVCIGDVGIVTAFGGFDFLFNICRARDDPINPEELPDNFAPIHPPLNLTDVREFREFGSGSYLASSSIVESQTDEQTPGLTFESSASEGAILTMPDGAFQEELGNLSKFRDYVAIHAANWYKFVNGPRGREAQNGDVRLVVGSDKTTSWGMATFANTSSAQKSNFRLKFRPLKGQQELQHNAGSTYAWEHSGVAEVRVGPEPGENEELGETPMQQFRNQCLFMRTLSVTLSDSVWAETFPGIVSTINQEGSQPEHHGQHLRPPNPNTARPGSSSSNPAGSVQGRRRSPGLSESEVAEKEADKDDEESSIPIQDVPWVSPSSTSAKESARSSPGDHVGSGDPPSDTRNLNDIMPINFVDKLYYMINDPELFKCMAWNDSGRSFIIWNVQMFCGFLESYFRHDNFSSFMRQLSMYGFHRINRISPLHRDQAWEFVHPKFIRDRPDLLHEIKRKPLEPHWDPAMKDEVELLGDSIQAPAQLGAMQSENIRTCDNPSKIINKYLLDQVPYAKIALTHDRDWSYVAKMGSAYLDPSKLIKEVTFLNDITVNTVLGIVYLEPKNQKSLLTVEEQSIIDQIEGHQITVEQYLFGSSKNHSTLLRYLINQLQSDYTPFCDQYTMPARETPPFLTGHPKRLLSLDDLVGILQGNLQSLEHHRIPSVRCELNALPPQHPDKGTWLLRLADALSRRFWQLNQRDDLEEAIWYYEEAVSLLPQTHYYFLEAILGLCSSVYQRFQLLGHLDDLGNLLDHLHNEYNLNLESLLTPVKAQLQDRPQELINKFSDSKVRNKITMNEGLNVPEASSQLDEEAAEEAAIFEKTVKDSAPLDRQGTEIKWLEGANFSKHNPPGSARDSVPKIIRQEKARTKGSQRSTWSRKSESDTGDGKARSTASDSVVSLTQKYQKVAIGKGATSVVRLAPKWDRTEEKLYTVKEFRKRRKNESEKEYVKKLTAEFCISSTLHHPNIVETVDLVQDENQHWCQVIEFCPGDLYAAIKKGGMSPSEVECCFKQILLGISYLHSQGVAHRDIKPENLFFDTKGRLKIGDYGASTVYRLPWETTVHMSTGLCGSEPYIAPEQFLGKPYDARLVDIWACGIVYYCLHFQELPWRAAQPATDELYSAYVTACANPNQAVSSCPPTINNLTPRTCHTLIHKMLEPDPKHRPMIEDVMAHTWIESIEVCHEVADPRHVHESARAMEMVYLGNESPVGTIAT